MTKKEAETYLRTEYKLTIQQSKQVIRQWKAQCKRDNRDYTLQEYLAPMLKYLKELDELGEFAPPKDKADGVLVKETITLNFDNQPDITFEVMHNLPNDYAFSLANAVESWVYQTDNYTADSLCEYINSKKTGYKIYPLKQADA